MILLVLAMEMPGPSGDHAGSASSHFMFVKKKDETAKEGVLTTLHSWRYFCVDI